MRFLVALALQVLKSLTALQALDIEPLKIVKI